MSYEHDHDAEVSALWKLYENGRGYLSAMGLSSKLPLFNRFYEGDQWPAPTKRTKGLPRPVVNFIKMIVRNKKAVILMAKARISFEAELSNVDISELNDFCDYIVKELGLAELDREAVQQACIEGTYIFHFYWDSEAVGKDGRVAGGVRAELLDPLSVIFENPAERDEQKQKWIIIVSRETVDSVRAKADKGVDTKAIVPDELDYNDYGTVEQDGSKLCTVLTRYFRKDGEVYVEQATKDVCIRAPAPIAPDVDAARAELFSETPAAEDAEEDGEAVDPPNNSLPDAAGKAAEKSREKEPLNGERSRAYLYPIVVGQYEPRKKSIYGIGEVEGLIPNQRYVNTLLGMALLNVMAVAWDKYVTHPNALRNQVISNEPGQVLTDYSNTNGNGIKRLGGAVLSGIPVSLCDTIMSMTRTVTGSTEVMSGETVGSVSSAMGISLLQEAAKHPINDLREGFWSVKKKQGLVLAQFFRLFYQGAEYVREVEREQDGKKTKVREAAVFDARALEGVKFDVVCEATIGTSSSTAGNIAFLDSLFAAGKIDLKTYVKLYPDDALVNKNELLEAVEALESEQLAETQAALQQVQAELARCQVELEENAKLADSVRSIISQNQELNLMLAGLYAESSEKLAAANDQINAGNARINEQMADINGFMEALAAEKGIDLTKLMASLLAGQAV